MAAKRKKASSKKKGGRRSGCAFWFIPLALGLVILFANTDVLNYLKKFLKGVSSQNSSSTNSRSSNSSSNRVQPQDNRPITRIINRDMHQNTSQNLNQMQRILQQQSSSKKQTQQKSSSSRRKRTPSKQYRSATIYFIRYNRSKDAFNLVPVQRKIKRNDSPARTVLQNLLNGPTRSELQKGIRTLIAAGTRIVNIRARGNILYIDLSRHFIYNQKIGREGMVLQIYQIVNSMTRFHNISGVRFLINGKTVHSAGGDGIILSKLFRFNSKPIR